MIEIDGSFGEGGGQILRTALSLSAITGKECRIFNIRKGREKPGLAYQHLLGAQNLSFLCQGKLEGDFLRSEELKFFPGKIKNTNSFNIKIPTAGSITLLLQSLLPAVIFSSLPTKILIEGGATDTFFSPTIDYFKYCFSKILEKINIKIELKILNRGYYPEGEARIETKIWPAKIKNLNLTGRGELKKILIFSGASESLKSKNVAERQIAGVKEIFGVLKLPLEEKVEYYGTRCPGSQICLIGEFENTIVGTDNLGKLGKRAEDVGKEAALNLLKEQKSNACLDKYLADQILIYLALAKKKSWVTVSEVTQHCKTNIWVIEKFLEGKFEIKDNLIKWVPLI
jgi:RNA 3'-phosphate cyclase